MLDKTSLSQIAGRSLGDCLLVLSLLAAAAACCYWLLPGADPAATEAAGKLFTANLQKELLPEPAEQRTYLLVLLLLPPVAALVIWGNRKPLSLLAGAALWLCFWGAMLFYHESWVKLTYQLTLTGGKMQLLAFLLFTGLLFGLFRRRWRLNGKIVLVLCCLTGLFFTVGFSVYNPTRVLNYFTHHYEILCYAVSRSALGNPTLHQYGFYPDFLSKIFAVIPLDIRNLNAIFALLNFITFLAMLLAFWQFCRHKIVAVLYTLVMVYFSNSVLKVLNGDSYDPYFAYYPIRTIVPALSILGVALYLKYPGRRWILPALGVLSGAGVFWNLDSGITVAAALWGWLGVEWFFAGLDKRPRWRPLLDFGIWFLAALLLTWGMLCWRHQMWLTFDVLFRYQKIFAVSGFYMLPLPPVPDAWVFFAAVPVIAVVRGLSGRYRHGGNLSLRWAMYVGLLALGLFSYYLGRSHVLVLGAVIYPSLILLFLWLDEAVRFARHREWRISSVLFSIPVLAMIRLTLPVYVGSLPDIFGSVAANFAAFVKNEPGVLELKAGVVRDFAQNGKINLFGNHQGLLYLQSRTVSPIADSGEIEIILEADRQRILNELGKSEFPLIVNGNDDPNRLQIPESLLQLHYRLVAADPGSGMRLYVPKKEAWHAE